MVFINVLFIFSCLFILGTGRKGTACHRVWSKLFDRLELFKKMVLINPICSETSSRQSQDISYFLWLFEYFSYNSTLLIILRTNFFVERELSQQTQWQLAQAFLSPKELNDYGFNTCFLRKCYIKSFSWSCLKFKSV